MKRRITLFLTTLGLLLIGFSLYWLIADTPDNPILEKMDYLGTDKDGSSATTEPVRQGLLIFTRDVDGRLEGIYRAPDWNREEDGSYTLKDPSVERYQKDGRAFFIRADEGQFIVEEVAGGMNPRRGWLKGNVRITLDLASGSNLSPPEDRPEDCIRIYVDHIRFNNDELEISSDSYVTVFSPDADVLGKGLIIRWNDNPQELRVLKILEGEQMTLRRIPAGLEVAMVSPSDLTSGETISAESNSPPTKTPLEKIAMLPSILKEALAATQPAQAEELVETAATLPATLATSTEPASRPDRDEKTPRRNIFLATFSDNVKVRSTQGTLSGADRLSLAFEWDNQNYSGMGRRDEADRPSASGPSETKPASPEGPMQQLVLTWTGPLTIEPLGYTPTPAADRYHVDIEGPDLVLADGRTETFCSRLIYSNVYQAGLVLGRAERPVTMQLSETEKIICPEVRFDRGKGLIGLVGAGQILSGKEELSAAIEPAPGDSITWQGSVLARLSEAQVLDKDGNAQTRPSISEALFREKVDLRSSKPGDFVQCDQLHVWLEEGTNGPYPARAEASGNVKASQDGSDISARQVAINFEESEEKTDTGQTKYKFNPTTLVASGSVTIVNDDGEKTTSAFADRLSANVSKNLAVLEGQPARIVQGDYSIQGARIAFDQNNQAAQVLGAGELSILTDRNFSGGKLDQARPVRIGWDESMQFDGVSSQADFLGGVKLNSELNSIQCDRMRATFVGVEEEDALEQSKPSGTMDLNMNRFGKLRLATVLSIGKVTVRSAQLDEEGKLLRRVKLTGDKLLYDAENGQIDSFGHGELLAEDYRPPEPTRKDQDTSGDQLSGGVERPWQTAFVWNNQMQFSQKNRSAVMDGDVGMIHRSGNKVLGTEGLNVPDWPGLKDGRTMGLSCGKLVARFDDPEDTGTDSKDMDPQSRVGRLRLFSATRDVNLTDGQYRLVGQRLIYHRTEGLAVLWGFLEGQPETRAYVYEENPLTHRVRSISSPKIHCFLQDGYIRKVETVNVQGGGAR